MIQTAKSITFCIVSFEGPDRYSMAGGLGVRVTNLAEELASQGYETHLLFVGDPSYPGQEVTHNGYLTLHRWCQWISRHHPNGVYEGDEEKLSDFNRSAPEFIVREIVRPALMRGHLPVILTEEWHTAEATINLKCQLERANLASDCVILWNANNTMSFERLDWDALKRASQLTTVSRYMKHVMWELGLNPLVIPNGIPATLLKGVPTEQVDGLRDALGYDDSSMFLFKVGRFDPAKRWLMSINAAADLKMQGHKVIFPLRGGMEPHGSEVFELAVERGLTITDINEQPESWEHLLALLRQADSADIYNLRFFMTQEYLRPFYASADAVLANSGHEPFGLVGLEAMAAGGIVFTGSTGEEYTFGGESAIALDTDAPAEIITQLIELKLNPRRANRMRQAACTTAMQYRWDKVVQILLEKIKYVAREQGAIPIPSLVKAAPHLTTLQYTNPFYETKIADPQPLVEASG